MTLASILLVDNDLSLRELAAQTLRQLGHDVSEMDDAGTALEVVRERRPDLMVLDRSLPDSDGLEILSDIKKNESLQPVRVVVTSGRNEPEDVVTAFEYGADDFIGKPYSMREFVARVGACLRRPPSLQNSEEIRAGGIVIDDAGHRVSVDDKFVSLAPREYRLLLFLVKNPDRVFSRRQLLIHVWDKDYGIGPRVVDVHIRRLRSILTPFKYDRYIQTVRGTGYRFSLTPETGG